MRIPSSTIVMTAIAAVPFGLAIRDTAQHRDRLHQREHDRLALEAQLAAEHAAADLADAQQHARLLAEVAARDQARRAHAHDLLGAFAASPGPAFAPVQLGDPVPDTLPAGIHVTLEHRGNVIEMMSDPADDDEGCSTLVDAAVHQWGEPAHDRVWLDLGAHRRASITPDCAVEVAQYEEPIPWVANLPVDAIGGSRAEVAGRFAVPDAEPDSSWELPGLDGDELTTMWPVFDVTHPDRLLGLQISTSATPRTMHHVIEALSARLRAKPTHGDDDVFRWKNARVELTGDKLLVVLGSDEP
jgi:hypothetical protein